MTRSEKTRAAVVLGLIIVSSLFVRFSYMQLRHVPSGDEATYIDVAKNVFSGKGYVKRSLMPSSATGWEAPNEILPIYIYSVVAMHWLTGYRTKNAQYINLAYAALLSLCVFFLALKLFESTATALLAAAIVSFDPVLTTMAGQATKDLSFCFFSLAFALVLIKTKEKKSLFCVAGIALALLILSRRNGYFFIPPFIAAMAIRNNGASLRHRLIFTGATLLTACILVLPWYIVVRPSGSSEATEVYGWLFAEMRMLSGYNRVDLIDLSQATLPPFSFVWFIRNYAANLQLACRTLISASLLLLPFLLFAPFSFIGRRPRFHDLYWGFSLVLFVALISLHTFIQTSFTYYLLPFYPLFALYAAAGFITVLYRFTQTTRIRIALAAGAFCVAILPVSEDIRNHIHPALSKKFDDTRTFEELASVVAWLNTNTQAGEIIGGCSPIRHLVFDLNNRLVQPPMRIGEFAGFFKEQKISWFVVGSDNLKNVELATARYYFREYWQLGKEGRLEEKNLPTFLQPAFATPTHRIYRVLSASDTNPPL